MFHLKYKVGEFAREATSNKARSVVLNRIKANQNLHNFDEWHALSIISYKDNTTLNYVKEHLTYFYIVLR